MKTRAAANVILMAALGVLVSTAALNADPLIPGKTRFGDDAPVAPAEKTQAQAKAAPAGDRVSVLVHMQAGADRGPVRGFAAAQGGFVQYEYDILPNVMNLRGIPQGALNALRAMPGVVKVEDDLVVHAHMNDSTPLIRALQSQISGAGLSADGSGIRVCIIDTGIDSDHIMYATRIDTAAGRDFVNNDNDPEDDAGHGSHVAGTALGGELSVNFGCVGSEPFQGIAPQATLIGIKVLDANGSGSFSDVIAGINYGADQTASGGRCDIINMSLGGGAFSGTCDGDSAAAAANNAVDAGVVVVASSGNDANTNAMGTPACGSKVIAVGATYDDDYPNCEFPNQTSFTFCVAAFVVCTQTCTDNSPSVDQITCMSNRSTELDVTAPGCITFSADKDRSSGGIVGFCGTSMAAPHVAGLAALLLSADSTLTPAEVRQHIRDGAVDLGAAGFDTVYGHGRIDAINSLSLLGPGCTGDPDCDDGLFCNGSETCVGGSCQAGTAVDCSDGIGCTDDSCNEVTHSCDSTANNANCDDGLFCNGSETCDSALDCQAGIAVNCDDGVGCTDDSCNEGTDSCDNVANDASCDNGVFCDGAETCDAVFDCQGGSPPSCDDGVGCTDDSCNGATDSCDNVPNDANCPDDGQFCNGTESCDSGADCVSSGDPCTGGDVCNEATDTCDPSTCNNNGTCDAGEDCNNCSADCISGTSSGASCGNGVCEAGDGEDCVSCPDDCNGKQNGKPSGRFCCGDGDGENPVPCSDSACTGGGNTCTDVPTGGGASYCCGDTICEGDEDSFNCAVDCGDPPVCGDATCDPGEDPCNCAADCGAPPATETNCSDGIDEDCDGGADCDDPTGECDSDPACTCGGNKAPCTVNGDCCSGTCKSGTCRGN
ncbi:MAG: S8 family serine peptidase [Planctomycetes bacterium]|nr:S8 family serine peptidase [Planctomycetota bacterium]